MGLAFSRLWDRMFGKKEMRILMVRCRETLRKGIDMTLRRTFVLILLCRSAYFVPLTEIIIFHLPVLTEALR